MPSSNAAARRNVLAIIASGKRHLKWLDGFWSVRGTVYEPHPDGPSKSGTHRPRRNEEYPENRQHAWAETAVQLDKLIFELTALRDYAERNAPSYRVGIVNHRHSLTEGE